MDIFFSTFQSVAVLLVIGILGFWIISRRILPIIALNFLSTLALDIALPSLIFVNIIDNFDPANFPTWWMLPLWWLGFTLFIGVLTALFSLTCRKNIRREFAISLFFQNALFFPLTIISGMFGSDSPHTVNLFLFTMFFPSLFFGTYHLFFEKGDEKRDWKKILNKVLLATLSATAIRLTGTQNYIPVFVLSGLKMVGHMTIPILMIILGGNIYIDFKGKGELYISETIKFLLIKNIFFPLICLFFLILIRPSYPIALMLIIQSVVPPVTAVPIVVERAGGNRNIVNQFMVAGFIFSLITIPTIISIFSRFFFPTAN
ncbi:MAG: AEC family transporter [Desulfobacterales bacterium]|nr:AEC family transporter [Desulfobacterales bacterium]